MQKASNFKWKMVENSPDPMHFKSAVGIQAHITFQKAEWAGNLGKLPNVQNLDPASFGMDMLLSLMRIKQ